MPASSFCLKKSEPSSPGRNASRDASSGIAGPGAATACAGPIAFVGLVAPHLARALTGPDNRSLLPLAALLGAGILIAADILGRVVVPPSELAAGIVAAILGGPFFIHVTRRFRLAQL